MIAAVIFDCDGVLVDIEILAHEVETAILDGIGLHYDRHEFTARFIRVNGVLAACAAGMRVWGFAGGGHMTERLMARLRDAGAERIVADWANAGNLFAAL